MPMHECGNMQIEHFINRKKAVLLQNCLIEFRYEKSTRNG